MGWRKRIRGDLGRVRGGHKGTIFTRRVSTGGHNSRICGVQRVGHVMRGRCGRRLRSVAEMMTIDLNTKNKRQSL